MALADVYDALISRRVYKDGMGHEKAKAVLVAGRGKHFDPDVVDAFLALEDEFQAIAARYADDEEALQKKAIRLARVLAD
jgi:putative two-component system response regulator